MIESPSLQSNNTKSNSNFLQHHLQYISIQQNQIIISSQINQMQRTYKQLEANLKYTQDMYQKNKDDQYVVPIDDTIQPMTDPNTLQQIHTQLNNDQNNINKNTIQLNNNVNPLQPTHTYTYIIGVTDNNNTNNDTNNIGINNVDEQPQERQDIQNQQDNVEHQEGNININMNENQNQIEQQMIMIRIMTIIMK